MTSRSSMLAMILSWPPQRTQASISIPNSAYIDEARSQRLRDAFTHAGKKIDMGRSCPRFKSLDDLDLAAIATEIASTSPADFIAHDEASLARAQSADP